MFQSPEKLFFEQVIFSAIHVGIEKTICCILLCNIVLVDAGGLNPQKL
jgi:hypothetical protein